MCSTWLKAYSFSIFRCLHFIVIMSSAGLDNPASSLTVLQRSLGMAAKEPQCNGMYIGLYVQSCEL